jgi:CubicO group peptidase (beta-lactamase class C family)
MASGTPEKLITSGRLTARPDPVPKSLKGWNNAGHFVERLSRELRVQIQGHYELKFEAVREAFAALFDDPQERGAALCIQVGGETVVDLWAGTATRTARKPGTATPSPTCFPAPRPSLPSPPCNWWPKASCNWMRRLRATGRSSPPPAKRPSRCANCSATRPVCRRYGNCWHEALYDWQTMVDALAAEAPWWTPGQGHGYAAITYGWLVGELLRRADGRGPGESIVARVAKPLGLDFHVGLADEEFHRVAHIARGKGNVGDAAAQRLLQVTMREPTAMTTRAFTNPPSIMTSTNKPEWRRMQQPAANGHGNARSLAGFYAGLLDGSCWKAKCSTN